MKVEVDASNPALITILDDPKQIITFDANFLIPPSRKCTERKGIEFDCYKEIWLKPIISAFQPIAIHEAVYEELITNSIRLYIDSLKLENPPKVIVL